MIVMQILIGGLTALGLAMVLADIYRLPTLKARKAASNLGKKGERKVSAIELHLKDFSTFLSKKIRLSEYTCAQLQADLMTAGMERTPQAYVADAITKALAIGIFAIPVWFLLKPVSLVILILAGVVYFKEYGAVGRKIKARREKIEYELPRFVSSVEKMMQHSKDVIYILESYKGTAGPELKRELDMTVADLRSGVNADVAFSRLETRVGSTMMSNVTSGLAALERGEPVGMYWVQLAIKFSDQQRQNLRQQVAAVPRKVRRLSMALLFCFMLIYVAVIGQVLLTSIAEIF